MLKIVVLLSVLGVNSAGDVSLVGVQPNKLALYQPNKDFTCFDGSTTIPFNAVNDDFCDCADGSDEPGTSACASAIFYCPNDGYYPSTVPSSRVNDGICDCCDGSDEYKSKNCSNTCEALGAQALAEAERVAELVNRGNSMRLQMSGAGKQIRQQKMERLAELTRELGEAERLKKDAEDLKYQAEARENAALEVYREVEEKARQEAAEKEKLTREEEAKTLFMEMDTDGNALLVADEILAKLKSLKSSLSKTVTHLDEEIKFIMNSKTEINFEEFLETTWNHLKSLLALENSEVPPPEPEEHEENTEEPRPEHEPVEEEEQEDDKHDVEEEEELEESQEQEGEHQGQVEEQQYGPKPPLDSTIEYDEETKRLMDEANKARQHLEETERSYKDIERDITSIKEFLEKDFGPEDEFLTLEGQCFSYSDREYTYKLCPFDQVVQTGKHGGSETRLGSWKSWENPSDYSAMIYDRGQSCWNGPQRSAKVHLSCGLENEVFGAAEPNKCEYVLYFRTPAACRPPSKHSKDNIIRDEL